MVRPPNLESDMNLVLRDPFFGDFDALFPSFFGGGRRTSAAPSTQLPRVTTRSDEDAYVLEAEVPGLKPEDVHVTVDDGVVTLAAKAVQVDEDDDGRVTRRFASGFERRFTLPGDVDGDAIAAKLEDGVLVLRLPRAGAPEPRQIPIS